MFQDPQTRQMNCPNMFRKEKIPVGRIIPPFFVESSEFDRFSIIYMIEFDFSGPEN